MKKAGVFFSEGLGDSILMIPLIKELKKQHYHVSGIFASQPAREIFSESSLFDKKHLLPEGTINKLFFAFRNFRYLDHIYLNKFSSTRINLILCFILSKKIITNYVPEGLPGFLKRKIRFNLPLKGIHDAEQNLRLLKNSSGDIKLSEEMLAFDFINRVVEKPGRFSAAVQISSGNSIHTYKNWPAEHWIGFLKEASAANPHLDFVLLGEPSEKPMAAGIMKQGIPRVLSLVGETSIQQAMNVIGKCSFFMGVDGGLLHIAAALGKPTFTIWGPSDFTAYGYQEINPVRHRIIYQQLDCRPCNSWISPNTSRVRNPDDCPDRKCMTTLQPAAVLPAFQEFVNELPMHAE